MSRPTNESQFEETERWVTETLGQKLRPYLRAELQSEISVAVVDIDKVIKKSGVNKLLAGWRQEDRKSNAGRKPIMTAENALVLILLQMKLNQPTQISAMTKTFLRLSATQLKILGLKHDNRNLVTYDRIWRAIRSLISLVDEFPGPRGKILKGAEYRAVVSSRDPEDQRKRRERMFTMANTLLEGTHQFIPKELRDRADGNVAIDATFIPLYGKTGNPLTTILDGDRWSANYDGGFYRRDGSHGAVTHADAAVLNQNDPDKKANGTSAAKRMWGIELEVARLTPNSVETLGLFPLITQAISFHIPGAVKGEGFRLFESLQERGHKTNMVIVDRAYSNGLYHEYAVPIRLRGGKHVFNYKVTELGEQAWDPRGFVQISGSWYLDTLPQILRDADRVIITHRNSWDKFKHAHRKDHTPDPGDKRAKEFKKQKDELEKAEKLYAQQHARRSRSRLKPKGIMGGDWTRRYLVPTDSPDYARWKAKPHAHQGVTVTMLRPQGPEASKPNAGGLKHEQYYEFQSLAWKAANGMRNGVESTNRNIKRSQYEDIANADNRAVQGNTFTYIVATAATVVENMRQIVSFYKKRLALKQKTSKNKILAESYWDSDDLEEYDLPLTG